MPAGHRGRHVVGGDDDDGEDATGDFARLGLGGFRRTVLPASSAPARMVFVSGGIQGGTIDETFARHGASSDDEDDDDDGGGGDDDDDDGMGDGEVERYSYADMQRILAMDLRGDDGDAGPCSPSSDSESDADSGSGSSDVASDAESDSGSDSGSDASESERDGDASDEATAGEEGATRPAGEGVAGQAAAARLSTPRASHAAPARAAAGAAPPAAAMSADALLSFLVAQPAILSMTLRRPGKGALGALAWRAEELDIEIVSEGNAIVLTKAGPGPATGPARGSAGSKQGAAAQLELGEALAAEYRGLGGSGKKAMPKHMKKQLKAAKRIRAQQLDFAAQRRLLHEVLTLSGGLSFGGKKGTHRFPRARSEPRHGSAGSGTRRAYDPAATNDAATRLTTTRHLEAIGEENKGHQMLKMMGWAGGALDGTPEGLSTPLTVDVRKGRSGLGHGYEVRTA